MRESIPEPEPYTRYPMFDTHRLIKQLQKQGFKEGQATSIVGIISESKEHDTAHLATREQVKSLSNAIEKDIERINERMATKEDLTSVKAEFKEDINNLKTELKEDIAKLNIKTEKLGTKIERVQYTILKWVMPFLVTLTLSALVGVFFNIYMTLKK